MEEIVFINSIGVRFSFKAEGFGQVLQWPVPREGEIVQLRRTLGVPTSMEGTVHHVEYYYSSGNMGPVVIVHLT